MLMQAARSTLGVSPHFKFYEYFFRRGGPASFRYPSPVRALRPATPLPALLRDQNPHLVRSHAPRSPAPPQTRDPHGRSMRIAWAAPRSLPAVSAVGAPSEWCRWTLGREECPVRMRAHLC